MPTDEAITAGLAAGPALPAEVRLQHNQAVGCYRQGHFLEALQHLDQVLARRPELAQSHFLRGLILSESGAQEAAVVAFDEALRLKPDFHKALYHRGVVRFHQGDNEAALADLEAAARLVPGFLHGRHNLGVVAVACRQWGLARDMFTGCLDLDPANRGDYLRLLMEIGRAQAMEEVYEQVHRLKNRVGVSGDELRRLASDSPELERVAREVERLYQDMGQFLRMVGRKHLERDLVRPAQILKKTLFAVSPQLEGVALERDLAPDLPEIIADRAVLGEVVLNVLLNAIQVLEGHQDPWVRVAARLAQGGEELLIEVEDNGPGIPPGERDRIFRFGVTEKREGSGLGLSYVRRMVEAHGGSVSACASSRGGACFQLRLPLVPAFGVRLDTLELRSLLFEDLRELVLQESGAEELRLRQED